MGGFELLLDKCQPSIFLFGFVADWFHLVNLERIVSGGLWEFEQVESVYGDLADLPSETGYVICKTLS